MGRAAEVALRELPGVERVGVDETVRHVHEGLLPPDLCSILSPQGCNCKSFATRSPPDGS